ncbi:oxidoreductase [Pseudonocardia lacus]|uniref:oxidoreductase n=1 Tax=Pseudonocardia lacus TaxID=2835865 RepID=UPI001BDCF920|nr:oxidoreductase [Pseudonocardia lacus]
MGLLDRFRRGRPGTLRTGGRDDEAHLRAWAAAHEGVEAFVEPRTAVTDTTMLLVDKDGDHTRRRIGDPDAARKLARSLAIPIYDVQLIGYPQRMRDHDARQKILREQERRRGLGETG